MPAIARLVQAHEDTVRDVIQSGQQDPPAIRAWAARHKVKRCFTPTSASWANPIEAQFGPRPRTQAA